MSKLKVNNIESRTNNSITIGASGDTVSIVGTLDGNQLSNISANNISSGTLADARLTSNVNLNNASTISTGTLADTRLTSNVNLNNASTISTGTLTDDRLTSNVTLNNASTINLGTLPDDQFPSVLPTLSAENLTNANASNVATGTLADARLTSNVNLNNASTISTGTLSQARLANDSITINGTAIVLGSSGNIAAGIDWQTTPKTTAFTAVAGEGYFVNTTSGAITVTLPASPSAGDQVAFKDYAATFATNNLTIDRNGSNIQGSPTNSTNETDRASLVLIYVDSTKGWLYTLESNVGELGPQYVVATGGTITTSGDYKIHTFNSSGTFTVTQVGNPIGSNTVDYLVVAAGGGAGSKRGGGGGAGGFRESVPSPAAWSASPLANPGGSLPVSVQGYPVTVGAGGAGQTGTNADNAPGGNSVFSTITSTGGGRANRYNPSPASSTLDGQPGGSGGGAGRGENPHGNATGGSGNTPSVSPPQGFDGGAAPNSASKGGAGGGGATAVGQTRGPGGNGGNGGPGATSSISGSSVTRAGGGAGGANTTGDGGGTGGPGGGGPSSAASPGTNGTANTGGGGGGGYDDPTTTGGTGGSGVVIIRYKFQ